MKNLILFVLTISLLGACQKGNNSLIGTWRLDAVLLDPGDGSGTFQTVNSRKTITFKSNNTLTSNGSLCGLGTDIGTSSVGTYSEADGTFNAPCASSSHTYYFERTGNTLIVSYPCIEACQARYVKR